MIDRKHLLQFLFLLVGFAALVAIFLTTPDFNYKRITVIVMALSYPAWGLWHQSRHGELSRNITWEYSMVGVLVLVTFMAILG